MNKKAMTLLEVLCTITIIAIVAGPMLTLFTTSRSNLLIEKKYMQAVFHAQRVMEEKLYEYDCSQDTPREGVSYPSPPGLTYEGLDCHMLCQRIDDGFYRLTVNVMFTQARKERKVELSTLYAVHPRKNHRTRENQW